MKFGLFQSVQLPEPGAQVRYYQEALQQVRWAEQLGFPPCGLLNTTSPPWYRASIADGAGLPGRGDDLYSPGHRRGRVAVP